MGNLIFWVLIHMEYIVAAIFAYFCGCFNGAVIVSKYILRDDVRKHGSGNAGLTNFYRTFGGPLTLVVILTDVLKAVVAILVAVWFAGSYDPRIMPDGPLTQEHQIWFMLTFKYVAGLFCLLGHMFPCMFGFKGGKGILSGGTVAIMIDWRIAAIVWGGFLIAVVLTRYVSLGSCIAGFLFPIATWIVYGEPVLVVFATIIGGGLVFMHRANIKRLLNGTESKFSLHKKKT